MAMHAIKEAAVDPKAFNLKAFVESLDVSVGALRLLRVDTTEDDNVVIAITDLDLPAEPMAEDSGTEGPTGTWVVWIPESTIVHLWTDIGFGPDTLDDRRFDFLLGASNELNNGASDRISRASVGRDKEDGTNIVSFSYSFMIPPRYLEPEWIRVMSTVVGFALARLNFEAITGAFEFKKGLEEADLEPGVDTDELDQEGSGSSGRPRPH